MDGFASLTDADVAAMHAEQFLSRPSLFCEAPRRNLTHDHFRYDLYDWSNWDALGLSYVPLQLSKGYFTYVSRSRWKTIHRTFTCFHANVQKNPENGEITKIYAHAGGNGHKNVTLHRFLARVKDSSIVVDHFTGLSLDNRDEVLIKKTHGQNAAHHDSSHRRESNVGMLRGVRPRGNGKFSAQIKHNKVTHCSRYFDTEEEAHEWYKVRFKEIFGFDYVDLSAKPSWPIFPPRKGAADDIPF